MTEQNLELKFKIKFSSAVKNDSRTRKELIEEIKDKIEKGEEDDVYDFSVLEIRDLKVKLKW